MAVHDCPERLLIGLLDKLTVNSHVVRVDLDASGTFNETLRAVIIEDVRAMNEQTIVAELQKCSVAWEALTSDMESIGARESNRTERYRDALVAQLTNEKLAEYYTNVYGFKRVEGPCMYSHISMTASPADIRAKCGHRKTKKRRRDSTHEDDPPNPAHQHTSA